MNAGSGGSNTLVISRTRGYLIAAAVTVVAVAASLPLQRTFDRFPYLPLLVAAVIVSAWTGGLGPGLLAAGGGAVAAELPGHGWSACGGHNLQLLAQLTLFVAVAAIAARHVHRARAQQSLGATGCFGNSRSG